MNGLIPKRSCVNPVLITTFGLEPSGHKKRGCRSAGRGAKRQKVGLGNRSPIKQKAPSGHKKMRVFTLIFLCPKPGSNRHVFLRTLDFESNASTNSAIRANGLRKNASNRLDFAKILQKAELSKCGKFK